MPARKFIQCFFIVAVISCSSPDRPLEWPKQPYFALQSGTYADFNIENVRYNTEEPEQISKSKYRRLIRDSVYRADGQILFPVEFQSLKENRRWETDSVTATWQTTDRLFELESGQAVIKISYPFDDQSNWDANMFNTGSKRLCTVTKINKPYQANSLFFPHTITVVRQDDSTLLSRKKYTEIYAENVGLIRRERINLQYCYTADCVGKGIISSGTKEVITIQNFGKQ